MLPNHIYFQSFLFSFHVTVHYFVFVGLLVARPHCFLADLHFNSRNHIWDISCLCTAEILI
jgi:hypothetical protein